MHALWMVLGAFLFATMAVCVKFASVHFNTGELLFYRGLVGIVFLGALARFRGVGLATRYPAMHAWRSLIGVCSLGAWFYAIGSLSVAMATTLNYMSSIWIAVFVLAGALLHWRPGRGQSSPPFNGALVLTILGGFAGVVLMLSPTLESGQSLFAALLGLFSGLAAALAYMQVVVLGKLGEPEERVVFYFAVGSTIAGAGGMAFMGVSSLLTTASLWLVPIGLLAALGQLCMTHAYSTAASPRNTLVVATLQYTGIVFAGLYSMLLFQDPIGLKGWLGMGIIILCGVFATLLRAKAAKPA